MGDYVDLLPPGQLLEHEQMQLLAFLSGFCHPHDDILEHYHLPHSAQTIQRVRVSTHKTGMLPSTPAVCTKMSDEYSNDITVPIQG